MINTLYNGIAIIIDFVVRSSDSFRDNILRFMGKESINCCVSIGNKVKTLWRKLLDSINSAIQIDDVFFQAMVGRGIKRSI